jgi:deazaflavin-dependent oxidoreductase (nitroreductase family)
MKGRSMAEQRNKVVDVGFKVMNAVHRGLLAATGGRFPRSLMGMTPVELRTIGRKSGQSRSTMLTSPINDDTRVVLVASKGGDDRDPQWYRNLSANPEVEVVIGRSVRKMRARTASPEEKATLWPDIVAVYKYYDSYQKRADRDIPVVICESPPV